MQINRTNVAHYLIARDLLDRERLVDGQFMAVEADSRNVNLKVTQGERPGFFLKQVRTPDAQSIGTLQREATCLYLAASDPNWRNLSSVVPRFRHYDNARNLLVSELMPGSENVAEYHARQSAFPPEIAAGLGRALAVVHGPVPTQEMLSRIPGAQGAAPWVLTAHRTRPQFPISNGRGRDSVQAALERFPALHGALEELRGEWTPSRLVHGDIKWENCVLSTASDGVSLEVRLVDWELADVGDPAWDTGSMIQAYLTPWIRSASEQQPFGTIGQVELPAVRRPIAAFWDAYADGLRMDAENRRSGLARAMRFAAARLVQAAYESSLVAGDLMPAAIAQLQVSANILADPERAVRDLAVVR
ncbi:MAG: phosphotransferase [Planctomycetota bacterium]